MMSGFLPPGGDPAALEQLAQRLESVAQGTADVGAGTHEVTTAIRTSADWTGDAADAYSGFTLNLSQGARIDYRGKMSGTAQPVDPGYDKVLSDLISYAHDDWLGMEVVASAVRDCFDHRPSYAEVRPLAIRAVRDLINAGASAGDVAAADGGWRFDPWPVSPDQAIQRIAHDLEGRDTYPEPGEIGWITFPDENPLGSA